MTELWAAEVVGKGILAHWPGKSWWEGTAASGISAKLWCPKEKAEGTLIQTLKSSVLILEPSRVLLPTIDPVVTSILSPSPKVTDNEGAAAVLELLTSVPGAHVLLAGCVQKRAGHSGWPDSRGAGVHGEGPSLGHLAPRS